MIAEIEDVKIVLTYSRQLFTYTAPSFDEFLLSIYLLEVGCATKKIEFFEKFWDPVCSIHLASKILSAFNGDTQISQYNIYFIERNSSLSLLALQIDLQEDVSDESLLGIKCNFTVRRSNVRIRAFFV